MFLFSIGIVLYERQHVRGKFYFQTFRFYSSSDKLEGGGNSSSLGVSDTVYFHQVVGSEQQTFFIDDFHDLFG